MLVRKDRPQNNSDNKTYNFGCGCRTAKFVLQFRLYYNDVVKIGGKKFFVYRVFMKRENVEDAMLHFKEMLVTRSSPTAVSNCELSSRLKKGNRKRGQTVSKRSIDNSDDSVRKRKTQKITYSHHHVKKFLKVVAVENVSLAAVKGISEGDNKMQFIRDGKELTIENCRNGVLSTQYPICVMDCPESIGMKVDVGALKGRGRNVTKAFEGIGKSISRIAKIVGNSTKVTVINVPDQEEQE
jgi:hypothetical protein